MLTDEQMQLLPPKFNSANSWHKLQKNSSHLFAPS